MDLRGGTEVDGGVKWPQEVEHGVAGDWSDDDELIDESSIVHHYDD